MRSTWTLVAVIAIGFAGCGKESELAQVQGTLRLHGAAVPRVLVCFVPDAEGGTAGPGSSGSTDENGHYAMSCGELGKPGAVVGKHRVVLLDQDLLGRRSGKGKRAGRSLPDGTPNPSELGEPPASSPPGGPQARQQNAKEFRFATKYMSATQSPLQAEVAPGGPHHIDFDLE